MKTDLNVRNRGFLATLEEIGQLLRGYCLGEMEDIIKQTTISSGIRSSSDFLVQVSDGNDPAYWVESKLPGILRDIEQEKVYYLKSDNFQPGKLGFLGFKTERSTGMSLYFVQVWNKKIGDDKLEYNEVIEKVFADHLKLSRSLEITVSTELPVDDGRFRLDFSRFIDQVKPIVFDLEYQDITGHGLAASIVTQTQFATYMSPLKVYAHHFIVQMGLLGHKKDNSWVAEGSTLVGTAEQEKVFLEFKFTNYGGMPVLYDKDKETASQMSIDLTAALEAA